MVQTAELLPFAFQKLIAGSLPALQSWKEPFELMTGVLATNQPGSSTKLPCDSILPSILHLLFFPNDTTTPPSHSDDEESLAY